MVRQTLINGVDFDAGSTNYCTSATARQSIIDNFSWNINDGGLDCGNTAPTDIQLSSSSINQSETSMNAVVGELITTDSDSGDSHTYNLVAGTGDDDNASFNIDGDNLRVNGVLSAGDYSIRVNTNDGTDDFAKALTIRVINEAPIFTNPSSVSGEIFATLSGDVLVLDQLCEAHYGFHISEDGTKLFIAGANFVGESTENFIFQYSLSTPFNLASATLESTYDLAVANFVPIQVNFSNNGSQMTVLLIQIGAGNSILQSYSLATPYDLSENVTLDVISNPNVAMDVLFNNDGTLALLLFSDILNPNGNPYIEEFALTTPYDFSTATSTETPWTLLKKIERRGNFLLMMMNH